jgi:hypothetical protein
MPWFMIDIEADGPIPGDYSMIELGPVLIDPEGKLNVTFHGKLRPLSDKYMKEALNVTLTSHADTFGYDHPKHVRDSSLIGLSRTVKVEGLGLFPIIMGSTGCLYVGIFCTFWKRTHSGTAPQT